MSEFAKRDFTQDERNKLADKGAALPDGSFPIVTTSDLSNAIHDFGRAKDPEKAKAHIISRARALGALDKLPTDWNVTKVKASEISTALGISNEPVKLNESHSPHIDKLHDAIGETKTAMQNKNNYGASTHLASAQRHLKDAKAVLDTKALNSDTKHILAKAALGRASRSLSNATSAAAPADKSTISTHNDNLKSFSDNPPLTFAKMNENHDEHGRFASGDGGGSSSERSGQGAHQGGKDWQAPNNDHGLALGKIQDSITKTYGDRFTANRVAGQPMSADTMDMAQAKEDSQNWIQDAHENLMSDNKPAAADALQSAADALDQHPVFSKESAALRDLATKITSGVSKSLKFSLAEVNFPTKA